jgi:serine protease Do
MARSFEFDGTAGVLISDVQPGGPADKGGLKPGDIVVTFNGEPTADRQTFRNHVATVAPGTQVKIDAFRGGKSQSLTAELAPLPDELAVKAPEPPKPEPTKEPSPLDLGLVVQSVTPEVAERLGNGDLKGVIVTGVVPGNLAAQAGIRPGDLIFGVGDKEIENVDEFRDSVAAQEIKEGFRMQVRSIGGLRRFVLLKRAE